MDADKQQVLVSIVRQLQQYDLNSLASVVATAANVDPSYAPSNALHEALISNANDNDVSHLADHPAADTGTTTAYTADIDGPYLSGLANPEADHTRAPIPGYATLFVATHKNACRAVSFSRDGTEP